MRGNDIELLVDGGEAFPEILRQIERARRSIEVNMFIWRADPIGCRVAEALLAAAQRGVQVSIRADRYGMILEMCEEDGNSFFHRKPTPAERAKITALRLLYPENMKKAPPHRGSEGLLQQLSRHPNVTLHTEKVTADHSKYYIFDDRVLIFGGINVEQKELTCDAVGRVYQDYMWLLQGEEYVKALREVLLGGGGSVGGVRFCTNSKQLQPPVFGMLEEFIKLIDAAERQLTIVMAYFAPVKEIEKAILRARDRGVKVRIMLSQKANFQNGSNYFAAKRLLQKSRGGIELFLSPKMLHTKLILTEKEAMLGSCNITGRAFSQLGELDLLLPLERSPAAAKLLQSVEDNFALCRSLQRVAMSLPRQAAAYIESRMV